MIFCDTSYLVRLYLEDPGWEIVRDLCATDAVPACELALAEIPAAFHRAWIAFAQRDMKALEAHWSEFLQHWIATTEAADD